MVERGILYEAVFNVEKFVWKQNAVRIVIDYNMSRTGYVTVVDTLLSGVDPEEGGPGTVQALSFLYPQLLLIMPVITLVCIPKISHINRIK
jgi:hypothetical protein